MKKASIAESIIGFIAFDEEGKIVDKEVFPKDTKEVAEKLDGLSRGQVAKELFRLIKRLCDKGYNLFVFEDEGLAKSIQQEVKVKTEVSKPSIAGKMLRRNIEELALAMGFVENVEQLREFLWDVSIAISRKRIESAVREKDLLITQTIQAIDELTKFLNISSSRAREWYGLHFPEMNRLVKEHPSYLKIVAALGKRANFTYDRLVELGIGEKKAKKIADAASASMGADLSDEDLEQIQVLCKEVLSSYKLKKKLTSYLDGLMGEVAPNLREIAGPSLGARLIATAGGLRDLAKMSASKIQILGAEKALFRALRIGGKPPKHGIIFQHPDVHSAEKNQRGRIARLLASKLAVASRADMFTGKYIAPSLKEDYYRHLRELRRR